jgi:exodeoxyribonuclease V gamma subunit
VGLDKSFDNSLDVNSNAESEVENNEEVVTLAERTIEQPKHIVSLLNELRAEGKLPAGQSGELALRPLVKQSTQLAEQIKELSQSLTKSHSTSQSVDIELVINDLTLIGRIDGLYQQNLILWRAGKLRAKDRIALYLHWLCLCANASQTGSQTAINQANFISTEKLYSLPVIEKQTALQQLAIWLEHWQLGADQILHFYPEAAWQWVTSQDINKTLNTFKGNDFATGEGTEAHIQRVCPDLSEHFDSFSQIAEALLLPLVALGESK